MTASLPAEDVPASLASFIRDTHWAFERTYGRTKKPHGRAQGRCVPRLSVLHGQRGALHGGDGADACRFRRRAGCRIYAAVSKLYDYPRCFRGIRRFIPDFRREGAAFCCEADNPHRTAVRRDAVRVPADGGCQQRRRRFNGVVCIPVDAAVHRCLCGKLFDFVAGTQVQNAIMAKSLPPIRAWRDFSVKPSRVAGNAELPAQLKKAPAASDIPLCRITMRKAPEHKRSPTIAPPMYIVPASGAVLLHPQRTPAGNSLPQGRPTAPERYRAPCRRRSLHRRALRCRLQPLADELPAPLFLQFSSQAHPFTVAPAVGAEQCDPFAGKLRFTRRKHRCELAFLQFLRAHRRAAKGDGVKCVHHRDVKLGSRHHHRFRARILHTLCNRRGHCLSIAGAAPIHHCDFTHIPFSNLSL